MYKETVLPPVVSAAEYASGLHYFDSVPVILSKSEVLALLYRPPKLARVLRSDAQKRHQHDTRSPSKEEEKRDEEWASDGVNLPYTYTRSPSKEEEKRDEEWASDGVNLPYPMQQSKQFGRVRVRLEELDDERIIDFAELLKKQRLNC